MNLSNIDGHLDKALKIIATLILPSTMPSTTEEPSDEQIDSLVSKVVAKWLSGEEKEAFRVARQIYGHLPKNLMRVAAVVDLRWQANLKAIDANYEDALKLGEEALRKARSISVPGWLTRDILLDLRNIELHATLSKGALTESGWQKQLLRLKKHAMLPMLDRALSTALENTLKELYEAGTDSPNTVRFGSNLHQVLESFGRAFAYATCLGSYTYFFILRERLAQVLYHYSRKFRDPKLVVNALKLITLQGKVKQLRKLVASEWETLYPEISEQATGLIEFPVRYDNRLKNQVMKCTLIELLGAYIYETQLAEIESFLYGAIQGPFAMTETEDLKRAAIRATKAIICRCQTGRLLTALIDSCDNPFVQDEFFKVLLGVKWNDVEDRIAKRVTAFLVNPPFKVLQNDIRYAVMVAIGKAHPDALKSIESSFFKDLLGQVSVSGTYLSLNFGEHSEAEISAALAQVIEKGKRENESFTKGNSITISGRSWVYAIGEYLKWMETPDWESVHDILYNVLMNPFQTERNKYEVLDMLYHLGITQEEAKNNLVDPLAVQIIENRDTVIEGRRSEFFSRDAGANLELAFYRLNLMKTNVNQEEIIAKAVEFGTGEMPEIKKESLKLLESLVQQKQNAVQMSLCPYLYAKCFDSWHEVRASAIEILSQVSGGTGYWENILINVLRTLVLDKSPMVRAMVVEVARDQHRTATKNTHKQSYRLILDEATRDSHYEVREFALKALNGS